MHRQELTQRKNTNPIIAENTWDSSMPFNIKQNCDICLENVSFKCRGVFPRMCALIKILSFRGSSAWKEIWKNTMKRKRYFNEFHPISALCSMALSGECILLGSVLLQQRFGVTDVKALGMSQLSGLGQTMLQLCVAALFYLDNNRKIHPRGMRACQPKDAKKKKCPNALEREREPSLLAPLFL